jgi:uncharacterized protein (DUF1499 family)
MAASGSDGEARRLAPCPNRPNCVSSLARGKQYVRPIALAGAREEAIIAIRSVLSAMPRVRIVEQTPRYLHAECCSRVFGFVDDLEVLLDIDSGTVHVRSASRVGYSDFGVNRCRAEMLREAFERFDVARKESAGAQLRPVAQRRD